MQYIIIEPREMIESVSIYESDTDSEIVEYEDVRRICDDLDIDTFEILRFSTGDRNYLVYLDGEGKLKHRYINNTATFLCDTLPFDALVGPVIIFRDKGTPETYYLDQDDVLAVQSAIYDLIGDRMATRYK